MKYLKLNNTGSSRLLVSDFLSYKLLEYPNKGSTLLIKPVSKFFSLNNLNFDIIDSNNIMFFRDRNLPVATIGLTVVYCFNYSNYFYFHYDESYLHINKIIKSSYYNSFCLEVTHDIKNQMFYKKPAPHSSFMKSMSFYEDEFPYVDDPSTFDFSNIQDIASKPVSLNIETKKPEDLKSKNDTAVCSCGFKNEYAEYIENYICTQCKLFKHMAS